MNTSLHSAPSPHEGSPLNAIARHAVASAFGLGSNPAPTPRAADLQRRAAVFVTIHDVHGELRGCVGTLSPRCRNVVEETRAMAREAAFQDRRFPSVQPHELPGLRFEVSILAPPEPIPGPSHLDPARFGLILSTPDGRRGALLPAIEGVDTIADQLDIARRKAGVGALEPIQLQRFEVERETDPPDPRPRSRG